jgi:IS5 family transposase
MSIIAQLPEEVRIQLTSNPEQEAALWQWVSQMHYGQVVEQAGQDHILVRIKQRFDLSGVEQGCVGYRRYAGEQGVEARYTLRQLCYGVLAKSVLGYSYAEMAAELRYNSLLRWFVGYDLKQNSFCAVTLWRFEQWLKENAPRQLFNSVLKVIDQDFREAGESEQIGDTFALVSRAREQSRCQLLRQISRKLLHYLRQLNEPGYQQLLGQMDGAALFGQPGEKAEQWLEKAERDVLEERTALAAWQMQRLLSPLLPSLGTPRNIFLLALQRWQAMLNKVLNDEFTFGQDETGVYNAAHLRSKHEKGSYVLGSSVDPEATFRLHNDKCELGYNVSVAATPHFIREIAAATGATPDSKGVAPLLQAQLEQLGLLPPKLIYDRAAGSPKIFAEVAEVSGGHTQLVARLIDHSRNNPRFGPQAFSLLADGGLLCPNQQTSYKYYRSGSGDGWDYRFSAQQCQGCPLLDRCRGDKVKADKHRSVFISDYVVQQRAALAYTKSEAFAQDMKLRPLIERIIACLVRYHGARRASGYGLRNADYQARMAAVAFNLKAWCKLTLDKEKACRTPKPDSS